MLADVGQYKARAQPVVILLQTSVVHFGKAQYAHEYLERRLHLGERPGPGTVPVLSTSSSPAVVFKRRVVKF